LDFGKAVHHLLERYLTGLGPVTNLDFESPKELSSFDKWKQASAVAGKGIFMLPEVTDDLVVEARINLHLPDAPVPLIGYVDLTQPKPAIPVVTDHKSTSGQGATRHELRKDDQAIIYTGALLLSDGIDAQSGVFEHLYYPKNNKPRGWRVSVELTLAEIEDRLYGQITKDLTQMHQYSLEALQPKDIEPDFGDCNSYGRTCPFLAYCNKHKTLRSPSMRKTIAQMMAERKAGQTKKPRNSEPEASPRRGTSKERAAWLERAADLGLATGPLEELSIRALKELVEATQKVSEQAAETQQDPTSINPEDGFPDNKRGAIDPAIIAKARQIPLEDNPDKTKPIHKSKMGAIKLWLYTHAVAVGVPATLLMEKRGKKEIVDFASKVYDIVQEGGQWEGYKTPKVIVRAGLGAAAIASVTALTQQVKGCASEEEVQGVCEMWTGDVVGAFAHFVSPKQITVTNDERPPAPVNKNKKEETPITRQVVVTEGPVKTADPLEATSRSPHAEAADSSPTVAEPVRHLETQKDLEEEARLPAGWLEIDIKDAPPAPVVKPSQLFVYHGCRPNHPVWDVGDAVAVLISGMEKSGIPLFASYRSGAIALAQAFPAALADGVIPQQSVYIPIGWPADKEMVECYRAAGWIVVERVG
jgi:hypothetical protein